MQYSPALARLIEALRVLPGVGPKSAQRMAFHLLERNRAGGLALASALQQAVADVRHCSRCRKANGTAYATNAPIATADFRLLTGQDMRTTS